MKHTQLALGNRSRSTTALRLGLALLAGFALVTSAVAQPLSPAKYPFLKAGKKVPFKSGTVAPPTEPNPYVSFLPKDAAPDWVYWQARARIEGQNRALGLAPALIGFPETEPNDSQATANFIPGFGTAPTKDASVDVSGSFSLPAPTPLTPLAEDEGSIPLATPTGLTTGNAVHVAAVVGDGPFGSAAAGGGFFSGDVDFYAVTGVAAGQTVTVDVDTPIPFGDLDSFVAIWSSAGALLAFNDDDGASFDSFLAFTAPAADDYFVSITGFGTFITNNPFDSSSGLGPGSEGTYEATIGLDYVDSDFFAVKLRKGDVLGVNGTGTAAGVTLIDPGGTIRVGSRQDLSFIYPLTSQLPGGGNAALAYVIEEAGIYALRVDGVSSGPYTAEIRGLRAPLESASPGAVQTLFIDFDGATINAQALFGGGNNPAVLSPLASFLAGWGLTPADEDAVIDAIIAAVTENLSEDMRVKGFNGDFDQTGIPGQFDVEILNSRDHADPFGQPNVSRLIVGGTIPEIGFGTIGIAESIDPGNFGLEETGVILLDLLSAPAPNPNSLNTFPLAPGATIIDLIGAAVGNITAHEAGHYLGNFHTEQFVTPPNIMDQGGNLGGTIGVGPDGIFGNADDIDVDFGFDVYVPAEGFVGVEDTLDTIAFGCPTPAAATVVIDGCDSGVANAFLADHTTISEGIGDCAAAAGHHGQFASCVSHFLNALKKAGVISGSDKGAIQSCAAQASIP